MNGFEKKLSSWDDLNLTSDIERTRRLERDLDEVLNLVEDFFKSGMIVAEYREKIESLKEKLCESKKWFMKNQEMKKQNEIWPSGEALDILRQSSQSEAGAEENTGSSFKMNVFEEKRPKRDNLHLKLAIERARRLERALDDVLKLLEDVSKSKTYVFKLEIGEAEEREKIESQIEKLWQWKLWFRNREIKKQVHHHLPLAINEERALERELEVGIELARKNISTLVQSYVEENTTEIPQKIVYRKSRSESKKRLAKLRRLFKA